jgi:hypothetical protein
VSPVTIKIYSGTTIGGLPVQTFTAIVSASGTFSATPPSPLALGTYTAQANQSDQAGNISYSNTVTYNVTVAPYNFTGFFPPVNIYDPTKPIVWNTVNSGQAIPVKFSLGGNKGLDIFESGYPASQVIPCTYTGTADPIETTVTAGGSSLSYDATSGQYTYVWKTDKSWGKSCRQFVIKFKDGSYQRADFNFTK